MKHFSISFLSDEITWINSGNYMQCEMSSFIHCALVDTYSQRNMKHTELSEAHLEIMCIPICKT